jgi:hypothetical protein
MKRLWCALFGHRDPEVWWEPWRDDPDVGRHRNVLTVCPRCKGVLALQSEVEGEPWTP